MIDINKHGVPLWAIKRLLICRVNLRKSGYHSFDIDKDGNVLFDGKCAAHVNDVQYDEEHHRYYIS